MLAGPLLDQLNSASVSRVYGRGEGLGRKERCEKWIGVDNGTDGDRSGEQKGGDESYRCSQPGPC